MSRRWRNPATRIRTRRFDPPWVVPVPTAPLVVPTFGSRRRLGPVAPPRRGEFTAWSGPPPQVTAPTRVPDFLAGRPPSAPRPRQGRFLATPPGLPTAPAWGPTRSRTRRCTRPPRGRFFGPVTEPLSPPGPAPLVPALHRRARARHLPVIRGRFARIPLVGLAPVTVAWPIRPGVVSVEHAATGTMSVERAATGIVTVE